MNTPLPTLDIVIPCYNESLSIGPCLDAILVQSDQVHHIIVVDNNSTDNTALIVKGYRKKHPQIKLIAESRQGIVYSRNAGMAAASADIIGRIDADTLVDNDWALQVRTYFGSQPDVGVASGTTIYYDLPGRKITEYSTKLFTHVSNKKLADVYLVYGANMAVRRNTWQTVLPRLCVREGIMEDQDIGHHAKEAGIGGGYIPLARARVSGRRMRMSPLRYWRYNKQWWMTFYVHGQHAEARRIRVVAWIGNVLQALVWIVFQVHDPVKNKYSLRYLFASRDERIIP